MVVGVDLTGTKGTSGGGLARVATKGGVGVRRDPIGLSTSGRGKRRER